MKRNIRFVSESSQKSAQSIESEQNQSNEAMEVDSNDEQSGKWINTRAIKFDIYENIYIYIYSDTSTRTEKSHDYETEESCAKQLTTQPPVVEIIDSGNLQSLKI